MELAHKSLAALSTKPSALIRATPSEYHHAVPFAIRAFNTLRDWIERTYDFPAHRPCIFLRRDFPTVHIA
jgi:hypothetical protein